MARASLAELQTQLEIAARLNYISSEGHVQVTDLVESLSKQLYALSRKLSTAKRPADG